MGHGHSHRAATGVDQSVEVGGPARTALLVALGLAAAATVAGLVVWWPSGDATEVESAQFAADGVTFPIGEVREVAEPCPMQGDQPDGCGLVGVEVDDRRVDVQVPPEVIDAGLARGGLGRAAEDAGGRRGRGDVLLLRDRP